jgi:hypothetical protein
MDDTLLTPLECHMLIEWPLMFTAHYTKHPLIFYFLSIFVTKLPLSRSKDLAEQFPGPLVDLQSDDLS